MENTESPPVVQFPMSRKIMINQEAWTIAWTCGPLRAQIRQALAALCPQLGLLSGALVVEMLYLSGRMFSDRSGIQCMATLTPVLLTGLWRTLHSNGQRETQRDRHSGSDSDRERGKQGIDLLILSIKEQDETSTTWKRHAKVQDPRTRLRG